MTPAAPKFGREHLRLVGLRLRELREARRWSLKRLAAESGVSAAALQKIEAGDANPSLGTVMAIAEVLGEPVDRWIAASLQADKAVRVVRGALPKATGTLASALTDARLDSRLLVLPPRGRVVEPRPDIAPLFAYVLDGRAELEFGDAIERLATGDSVHIAERWPSAWINPLARPSLLLLLVDRRADQAA